MGGAGTGTQVSGVASTGGLVTGPAFEPVTLSELKLHTKVDSGSFADNIDETQSIVPGAHVIAAAYSLVGTGVEVLGYTPVVILNSGTNLATGTVDVKIQDSDDNTTWADWSTGAFTQVTTANDNAIQEKAYTGTKRYIRTVATVALATCDFGTTIIRLAATSVEDDLLNAIITAAREHVEDITRRAIITQTWDYFLDAFPGSDFIKLPYGNLQSGGLIMNYYSVASDGTKTTNTMTLTTDYLIEQRGDQCGGIRLPYGDTWPSFTAWPVQPIRIRYVCGWTTRALVPYKIKAAIKLLCADLYTMRGEPVVGQTVVENKAVQRLLASCRLWDEF